MSAEPIKLWEYGEITYSSDSDDIQDDPFCIRVVFRSQQLGQIFSAVLRVDVIDASIYSLRERKPVAGVAFDVFSSKLKDGLSIGNFTIAKTSSDVDAPSSYPPVARARDFLGEILTHSKDRKTVFDINSGLYSEKESRVRTTLEIESQISDEQYRIIKSGHEREKVIAEATGTEPPKMPSKETLIEEAVWLFFSPAWPRNIKEPEWDEQQKPQRRMLKWEAEHKRYEQNYLRKKRRDFLLENFKLWAWIVILIATFIGLMGHFFPDLEL
ncbi:hypothetical protein [Tateyamaria pelophila]|uniref:hypothetical protein n=1 Tax=Tateyamaria pelophila TaxID=328415 RepID=UPI001CBD7E52|nr:hypothetical protein [Tateyamaria pelophila]